MGEGGGEKNEQYTIPVFAGKKYVFLFVISPMGARR